jgi:purine-binding chemotaxis protein CheW
MATATENRKDELIQLVSFNLGSEEFGIDILKVQEINRMVDITRVPQAPHYVEGVINLRGKIIPVIDLRTKFEMERRERDKDSRIVVCDVKGDIIGLVVDGVSEVLRIPDTMVEKPPTVVSTETQQYISGVVKLEGRLLLFLDISRLAAERARRTRVGLTLQLFQRDLNGVRSAGPLRTLSPIFKCHSQTPCSVSEHPCRGSSVRLRCLTDLHTTTAVRITSAVGSSQ